MKMALLAMMITVAVFAASDAPQFTADNQLIRPEGYREWIYLSSGLGMSYGGKTYDEQPDFTNVFIKPESYREFIKTGEFPEGTVLVLEIRRSESTGSINKGGQYQTSLVGIEASVKDSKRFPEKWAYFGFIGPGGAPLPQAKGFPKDACWKCHAEHAAADNVFTQFYPALREAREEAAK
jgi:hypothetical protein